MKKRILMLIVAIAFFEIGCINEDEKVLNSSEEDSRNIVIENINQENNATALDGGLMNWADYMASVKEQSDIIKISLENDALTQVDMNLKSEKLYELWDNTLNYLWNELESTLPKEEFIKLQDEQSVWIAKKEKTLKEVGKEFEGGSIYSLIVNGEAARITEDRVFELYELLK